MTYERYQLNLKPSHLRNYLRIKRQKDENSKQSITTIDKGLGLIRTRIFRNSSSCHPFDSDK